MIYIENLIHRTMVFEYCNIIRCISKVMCQMYEDIFGSVIHV